MKKIYSLLTLLSIALMANAIPANPTPFVYTMPDGTEVMAVLHGDEFHSYITDLDGNLLEGTIPTAEEYRVAKRNSPIRRAAQAGSGFPLKGSPRSIAILVNFKDVQFQYAKQDFENLLNQSGYSVNGATGSCRDYFIASSDSLFSPQFDVFGPVTLSKTAQQYLTDEPKYGTSALVEAIALASADGLDFSQYDTDGDGLVDNIFFYYAGHNQAEGGGQYTIWPHQGTLSYKNLRYNGKAIGNYACTSELKSSSGNTLCAIGTFCHEFGHVLGLPDLYDTGESDQYTIGSWDIMCSGSYNNSSRTPPSYTAYERCYLGWRKPVQLTDPGQYTINPLTDKGEIYLIANGTHNLNISSPSPSEFFLIEHRQNTGWDAPSASLPATGILVWHIDYSAQIWSSNSVNNSTPLRVHLEEAGGRRGTSAATDPYPGASHVTAFVPKLHDGTTLDEQPVYDIQVSNNIGSFIYISRGEQHLHAYPETVEIETTIGTDGKPKQWEAFPIHLTGEQLALDEVFTLTVPSKNQFKMSFNPAAVSSRTSTYWNRTLTLRNAVNAEGRLDTTLYINFNPQKQNCDVETASLSIQSDSNRLNIVLNGSAPRHTYVTTPTLKPTSDITPYTFTVNWKAVTDAEEYYISVFRSEQGTCDETQNFEAFTTAAGISEQGWSANFVATTTGWKKDGQRAVLYKNNGDRITSAEYMAPLSELAFYLNAFTADVDTIGELIIEGRNALGWQSIDTLRLPAKTKAKLFKFELDTALAIRQLRFTYWDNGGNGLAMDALTATMSEKITYLYRGRELAVSAYSESPTSHTVGGLKPDHTYFYQLQCTDLDKGCEEHLTAATDKVMVQTLSGVDIDEDDKHLGLIYERNTHTVCVPEPSANARLYVLDRMGQTVYSVAEEDGQYSYPLPTAGFTRGQLYIVKQVENGRVRRKQRYVKFVY